MRLIIVLFMSMVVIACTVYYVSGSNSQIYEKDEIKVLTFPGE